MDAFDADVLIYACAHDHPLGKPVRQLFDAVTASGRAGVGSLLLLPEVLSKPMRDERADEVQLLAALLARLDLRPVDSVTAQLATVLGASYALRAADAIHLATAVNLGADRFITNNQRDFSPAISEIEIVFPVDL